MHTQVCIKIIKILHCSFPNGDSASSNCDCKILILIDKLLFLIHCNELPQGHLYKPVYQVVHIVVTKWFENEEV